MENLRPTILLKQRIMILEQRQAFEDQELKLQFNEAYQQLKPLNLIKNTFKDISSNPAIKSELMRSLLGIASGFFANRLLLGSSAGIIKKLGGLAIEFGLLKVLNENSDNIKSAGTSWLKKILSKKKKLRN